MKTEREFSTNKKTRALYVVLANGFPESWSALAIRIRTMNAETIERSVPRCDTP